jgi:hypothetical protein
LTHQSTGTTGHDLQPKAKSASTSNTPDTMHLTRIIPTTLAALALGIGPGHGAISVVNTNGTTGFVQANPPLTRTWSFDAGATAAAEANGLRRIT